MKESFAQRVKQAPLTTQEQQIADKIIRNLSRAAFFVGPQLAKECGVSASAITRFAQKLGYSGFPELKLQLEELFRQTITPYEMFNEFLSDSRKGSVCQESIAQDLQNIMNMPSALDENILERVITAIETGNTIYLTAIAASDVAVQLLSFYFSVVLGKSHTTLTGYGVSTRVQFTDIGPDDVLIAISYQRIFREIRDAVLFAKDKGACTIAITDSVANALATVCDFVLIAPVTGATFGYSHAAPVAMVNIIVNSLASRNPELCLKNLEKIREIWNTIPLFCQPPDT